MGIKIPMEAWKNAGVSEEKVKEDEKKKQEAEEKNNKIRGLYNKGGFLSEYYIDGYLVDNNPNADLFNKHAIGISNSFSSSNLTSTKLRQYYDIVNGLYQNKVEDEKLKTELNIMLAKANYDYARKNVVPKEFIQFLNINIDLIFKKGNISENFKIFKKHFEAVVAYSKGVLKN